MRAFKMAQTFEQMKYEESMETIEHCVGDPEKLAQFNELSVDGEIENELYKDQFIVRWLKNIVNLMVEEVQNEDFIYHT